MEQPAGVRTLYLFIFGKFEHILSPLREASRDPQAQTHTHTHIHTRSYWHPSNPHVWAGKGAFCFVLHGNPFFTSTSSSHSS